MILTVIIFLIGLRPFIASLAFPYEHLFFSILLFSFLACWLIRHIKTSGTAGLLPLPLACWLFCLIVTSALAGDRAASLESLFQYVIGAMLFVFAFSLPRVQAHKTVSMLVWAAVLISGMAVYQYLFGFRHLGAYIAQGHKASSFAMDYIRQRRAFLPFVTPNILGGYLAMLLPLAFTHSRGFFWRTIIIFAALILTRSLGALSALSVALLVYRLVRGKIKPSRLFLVAAIMLVAAAAIFIWRSTGTQEHLTPSYSASKRVYYWKETLEIIKRSPLTGVGPGNFNLRYSRYAHNSFLQIWAETGLAGLLSLFWLIFWSLRKGGEKLRGPQRDRLLCALIASGAAFLTDNCFSFGFFLPEVSAVWWVVLGLSAAYPKNT